MGQTGVKFGNDPAADVQHRASGTHYRLEIAVEESHEDIVGQHGSQPKIKDRCRVMFVDVIASPARDEFIKSPVFDIPPVVTNMNERHGI